MEVDEVHDVPQPEAVGEVADGAGEDRRGRQRGSRFPPQPREQVAQQRYGYEREGGEDYRFVGEEAESAAGIVG